MVFSAKKLMYILLNYVKFLLQNGLASLAVIFCRYHYLPILFTFTITLSRPEIGLHIKVKEKWKSE